MTTPKIKCEGCGYEGEISVEIYGGLCQYCGEKVIIKAIILDKISQIKGKGTEINPEYYLNLIVDIMRYGGLDFADIKRYLTYFTIDNSKWKSMK